MAGNEDDLTAAAVAAAEQPFKKKGQRKLSLRSDKPVMKTVVRQQFSHGRSRAVLVEIRGTAGKPKAVKLERVKPKPAILKPEKPKPEPKPEKPNKKITLIRRNPKKARAKKKKGRRRSSKIEHLFRFSEPMGPSSVSYEVKIPASSDRYLLSAGLPGNEETD